MPQRLYPKNQIFHVVLSSMIGLLFAATGWAGASVGSIVQKGFEGFRGGTLGDFGANTYVSADGGIQTIHRWDLNRDGELDLIFTQDHNFHYAPDAMIYWGGRDGPQSLQPRLPQYRSDYDLLKRAEQALKKITWLPSLGGGRGQIADLNNDGWLDIISGNMMHNFRQDMPAYIYWGSSEGFEESERTILPAYIASGVAVGDFNEDGMPDIALANQGYERGFDQRFGPMTNNLQSYIYWGHPTGFDVSRRAELPTISAADVATGDFNGDGHADLAFVNNLAEEQSVYVYWGDGRGAFSEGSRQVLKMAGKAVSGDETKEFNTAYAADLNADQWDDLVIAGTHSAVIHYGGNYGFSAAQSLVLSANHCHGLVAADLNGDGRIDLVVANAGTKSESAQSVIYWGREEGYDAGDATSLSTLGAMAVQAADLNNDGSLDLVFGNVNTSKDVPSQIFWGSDHGFIDSHRSDLQSFGAMGVGIADFDRDGNQDVVLLNHLSGNGELGLPTQIYWGNAAHHYSIFSATQLQPGGYMMYTTADFDDNGYPDLVLITSGQAWLWWGSESGYDPANRMELPISSLTGGDGILAMNVADLNRDGYLDLVCSGRSKEGPRAIILYGNAEHFKTAHTETFILPGNSATVGLTSLAIADMNRDGYLDLVCPLQDLGYAQIRWGGPEGYKAGRITKLDSNGGCQAAVADLDHDGWLDIIFTSGLMGKRKEGDPVKGGTGVAGTTRNSYSLIYWGNAQGDYRNPMELETYNSLDVTVADLNRDGHLDLAYSNYLADTTRELPAFIYWGDGTREGYSVRNRTMLDAASSSAIDALDLNRDGWLELIITNHQKNFSHTSGTNIYWGSEEGYSIARRDNLPTIGSHMDAMVDAGNIYDRHYEWDYLSSPIEAIEGKAFSRLKWKGETPFATGLKFQIRTAKSAKRLAKAAWKGPDGSDSFYTASGSVIEGVERKDQWLQYRAVLTAPDGGNSPILTEVEIVCVSD